MFPLRQYLFTLDDPQGLTRTLRDFEVLRDAAGRPLCTAGNSAAVFRIRHEGRIRALRCYMRPMRHLAEIYGPGFLPEELYLYTAPAQGRWVDVVLCDWLEGVTLQEAVAAAAAARDRERLAELSVRFDRLAAELLADDWAHGDLKPENILVGTDGALHLLDFDAVFLPAFAGETSPELGTAAFQHPTRTSADFDARLDDYPAALIATALHALARDPSLYDRYGTPDGLLFTPQRIAAEPVLEAVLALFEHAGCAAEYRIAQLLLAPTLRLPQLPRLFEALPHLLPAMAAGDTPPELFVENGRWGYRSDGKCVIPPLYDCGFDFTEGLAAVRLGRTWHYIDPAGRTVLSCPGCEAVKPFRGGRATVVRDGSRTEIDRSGRTSVR